MCTFSICTFLHVQCISSCVRPTVFLLYIFTSTFLNVYFFFVYFFLCTFLGEYNLLCRQFFLWTLAILWLCALRIDFLQFVQEIDCLHSSLRRQTHARPHTHMHARTYTNTHTQAHAHTHAHMHTHAQTHTHTPTHFFDRNAYLLAVIILRCIEATGFSCFSVME